jgi:hypothetical protein
MIWIILLSFLSSIVGSLFAWLVVIHFDWEGLWEQRRLEHGKKLDQRQLEAARKHGHKGE